NLAGPAPFHRRLAARRAGGAGGPHPKGGQLVRPVPKRKVAAYQTAKFGLVGLSQSLRYEYGPAGLGVTALCPGWVDTDIVTAARERGWVSGSFRIPSSFAMPPDRVAARAVRAIRRNEGLVAVGVPARLLWMLHRLSPALVDRWQHRNPRPPPSPASPPPTPPP